MLNAIKTAVTASLMLIASTASATQIVIGEPESITRAMYWSDNVDNPSPGFDTWIAAYDLYTFDLASKTTVTIDGGGSKDAYGADLLLSLYSGTGIDPNSPTSILAQNDAYSGAGRIAPSYHPHDSFLSLILNPGSYSLFVSSCCQAPGNADAWRDSQYDAFFYDDLPDIATANFKHKSNYILYVDGATLNQVSPVPVPATLPLFGSALGLMGFVGWRKRK